ncbi:SAM-dependent methyltransferase [Candidatus Tremblaya phenacola]|uniref:SAM-dependent methyltransferase n=1 Tax=Candidatus Tremblayella phenacoccinincola TaxID=1010676 RepID=UPI000C081710|nr:SAM-dependent methyltransferase [Candidatus Tremblaya phenacola]
MVPSHIVPGITTAIGTTVGIPLTHRNYSNSVSFTTGSISYKSKPNWSLDLNKKQTIIMYMYASNITKLKEKLLKSRFSNKIPIAIVSSSSNKDQKLIISNIKSIESLTYNNTTPSILIIGYIINLYRGLTTFN